MKPSKQAVANHTFAGAAGAWLEFSRTCREAANLGDDAATMCQVASKRGKLGGDVVAAGRKFVDVKRAAKQLGVLGERAHSITQHAHARRVK